MRRAFFVTIPVAVVAAVSFLLGRHTTELTYAVDFPDPPPSFVNAIEPNGSFACTAAADAFGYESHYPPKPIAKAQANAGTDKLALRVAPDGKGIYMLTAASTAAGVTDAGDRNPIVTSTSDYVVASKADLLAVTTIILSRKTLKGVWNFTGLGMLGMEGQSVIISCH
jgi:hypothetical protein